VNKGYDSRGDPHSGGGNTVSVPSVIKNRSSKKPKPEELQFAELAEFSAGQGGQRSSTSPTNRHTETQYADVNDM